MVVETPDSIMSLVEHLRGNSVNASALYADRCAALHAIAPPAAINLTMPAAIRAQMPTGCIVVTPAGGYGRGLRNTPLAHHRANLKCYAAYGHDAARMATLVRWLLLPPESLGVGWTAAGTTVVDVLGVTSPVALSDPTNAEWQYRDLFAEFTAYEMAVA